MLQKLIVSNFALIEEATLDFDKGFTVITGETGSGKSILLGALGLITGGRADFSVIRDTSKKTFVEAVFTALDTQSIRWLEENDLDVADEVIVRREINAKGKSRAFINDTPVQIQQLKEFGLQTVNVHSQHQTIDLKNKQFQLGMLDDLVGANDLKEAYFVAFQSLKKKKTQFIDLKSQIAQIQLNEDFNKFQLTELNSLQLGEINYDELSAAVKRAEQFEGIKMAFESVVNLVDQEGGVNDKLVTVNRLLNQDDTMINELKIRLEQVRIELKDIAALAEDQLSEMEFDPRELALQIQQLDAFNAALNKHNKFNQSELLAYKSSLEEGLSQSEVDTQKLAKLANEIAIEEKELLEKANVLSLYRQQHAPSYAAVLADLLADLKLNDAKVYFDFKKKELSDNGLDDIQLLFAPNKGMTRLPVEKAASGGELSRLMLAIQSVLAQKRKLPTVVFDEIDTGVSGEVAERIGLMLKGMGNHMQIFAVTHLPQVASKGQNHIKVFKSVENEKTLTIFVQLNKNERIEEIAKLMSGKELNEAAILNAKKLLNQQ